MIPANELRIGNYVLTTREENNWKERYDSRQLPDGKEAPYRKWTVTALIMVDSIDDSKIDIYTEWGNGTIYGTYLSEIEPVPLTPEILEKCGFVAAGHRYFLPRPEGGGFGFEIADIGEHFGIQLQEFYVKIRHLHQLQNLYFALTGKELEVKL